MVKSRSIDRSLAILALWIVALLILYPGVSLVSCTSGSNVKLNVSTQRRWSSYQDSESIESNTDLKKNNKSPFLVCWDAIRNLSGGDSIHPKKQARQQRLLFRTKSNQQTISKTSMGSATPTHAPLNRFATLVCNSMQTAAENLKDTNHMYPALAFVAAAKLSHSVLKPRGTESDPKANRLHTVTRALKFWRRIGPIAVDYKFTQFWLERVVHADRETRDRIYEKLHNQHSPESLQFILDFRGLFVKIGQVLSSRADFVPRQYIDKFATLHDNVPATPTAEIRCIISDSLATIGLSFDDVFESLEHEPIGTASIGQVHKARLTDRYATTGKYAGGGTVAVKVMRPDSKVRFIADFRLFKTLVRITLPSWSSFIEELERRVMNEFDYRDEAVALNDVRDNIFNSRYKRRIKVPEAHIELCTRNLLIMELLNGKKIADSFEDKLSVALDGNREQARQVLKAKQRSVLSGEQSNADDHGASFYGEIKTIIGENARKGLFDEIATIFRLMLLSRQAKSMLDLLLDVSGHQMLMDGVFNSDPHPGNVLDLFDGRLGLIDYGQVQRLKEDDRIALANIVFHIGNGNSDEKIAGAMREFGFRTKLDTNEALAKFGAIFFDSDAEGFKLGFSSPQLYFESIMKRDPLVVVPDAAVMAARCSFLLRGLGSLLQQQIRTSERWQSHAQVVLKSSAQ
mmetsp:Transcript_62153/g.74788  ORF Transcript_62153/g.74788 Transcript_62153/m.74788 type:complete len:686 (+) Transcript_62153:124-2181(+)